MKDFAGKVAVVTGAASGIGRALAERCAAERMAVVIADVDEAALESLHETLWNRGARSHVQPTDVSDPGRVEALAEAAWSVFGGAQLVFNNAGVLATGTVWECSREDWAWVLGVNLWGVIHGVRSFVPRLLAQGEPAHVVNTASVGGLISGPYLAPYLVSKHAVVALSEALHHELRARGASVRVSALCPGAVRTGIAASERVRPERLARGRALTGDERGFAEGLRQGIDAGMDPEALAEAVFEALREERFWILPDPSFRAPLEARLRSILAGGDPADSGALEPPVQ